MNRAREFSPFLRLQLERFPEIARQLADGATDAALQSARAEAKVDHLAAGLRRERSAHALVLAVADLAGLAPFEQVTAELSDLADRSLEKAVAGAIAERTPGEAAQGFAVIGLGKLGGRELNYSSDVDLLF
ncbi:MAG TPA: glutamine-synthetase adenylyltransferase, partial [Allosphingosinicella sp.]|nr:glutamine-synthetase adenylyltransferase [Allosphingosinicella sp.]